MKRKKKTVSSKLVYEGKERMKGKRDGLDESASESMLSGSSVLRSPTMAVRVQFPDGGREGGSTEVERYVCGGCLAVYWNMERI